MSDGPNRNGPQGSTSAVPPMSELFFNTEGPVVAGEHYRIPPLDRVDLDGILSLIRQKRYFVIHAPRQTGKTSTLEALVDLLNESGGYRAVYVNVESGQSAREDVGAGMAAILSELASEASDTHGDDFLADSWAQTLASIGPHNALRQALSRWAAASELPVVLLIDEVDALIGDTLLSVLRQLRSGYRHRPGRFPQSIVLCGVRDVRDYRIQSKSERALVTGGSAFNISAGSLRLGDFSREEVEALLHQHTEATGQPWRPSAEDAIWDATRGQPWLVNALAQGVCGNPAYAADRTLAVDAAAVHEAREQLVQSRTVHLDQLAHKLGEERVRRVLEPVLSGTAVTPLNQDDVQYVRDLGLVGTEDPVAIANPIYREVIPRELTATTQATVADEAVDYIDGRGQLDVEQLLVRFQAFFREHSEHWVERFQYREAGPQLLLQAFLQRTVNGGGRIEREYGLGRRRTDLLIVWPSGSGEPQRIVIECKVLHRGLATTIAEGVAQTRDYMDRCAAAQGHLVIFDRTTDKPWAEKLFRRVVADDGAAVTVWGV